MASVLDDLKMQYRMGDLATRLIFWNVLLYIVPEVVFAILRMFRYEVSYYDYIQLSSSVGVLLKQPWTLVTYGFFHAGLLHLVFNMIMLFFVARLFTTFFTQKQLFGVYVLGIIFSGVFYVGSYLVFPVLQHSVMSLVGASGGVMAILFATTAYSPYMEVRLFGVFKVRLWHIAFLYLFLDLVQLPRENTGGHLAHIGGALFGYLFVVLIKRGTDITYGLNRMLDGLTNLFSKKEKTKFKRVHVNPKATAQNRQSRIVVKDKKQQQIDEILDKISQSGYDSLTKEEKDFLFNQDK